MVCPYLPTTYWSGIESKAGQFQSFVWLMAELFILKGNLSTLSPVWAANLTTIFEAMPRIIQKMAEGTRS